MQKNTITADIRKIPLSVPNLCGNEWSYVKECLDTGWVSTAGPYVNRFEKEIASYTGASRAVACASGTAGLHTALVIEGVSAGDEVIVPTVTFIAPVNAVHYQGAEPVFMDCDQYLNIDVEKVRRFCEEECERTDRGLLNRRSGRIVRAIIPVHVFGIPCDMDSLMDTADNFSLAVIEDASESLGSRIKAGRFKGRHTGTIGKSGVLSFNGNKIITTGGGGMIMTNDDETAEKARYLTTQAKDDSLRFIHNEIGFNYRMTNISAALGCAQLEKLDEFVSIKRRNYDCYRQELRGVKGLSFIDVPQWAEPNYWIYPLLVEQNTAGISRDDMMASLSQRGLETRPLWELNHMQKPYEKNQHYEIEKALFYRERVLCLPCSTSLTEDDVVHVSSVIRELCANNG